MSSKINKIIIFSAFLSGLFALLPCFANAQSLSLASDQPIYKIGSEISVVLSLDTGGNLINVVDGTISFPEDFFDLESIKTGDSFLTMWPERPALSADGKISFTGGIPHGFNASYGNVFSFILKSKKVGQGIVSIADSTVLLNDGLGTELKGVTLTPLKIAVTSFGNIVKLQPVVDKIPPLPFEPIVTRSPSAMGNKFFVSFSAVDKETGISYYEVREEYVLIPFFGPWYSTNWQKTETPYILKFQHWWSRIHVRAYDGAGNFREEVAVKPLDEQGYAILNNILIMSIIIFLLLLAVFAYFNYKKYKSNRLI